MIRVTIKLSFRGNNTDALLVTFNYYPELGPLQEAINALLDDHLRIEVVDLEEEQPTSDEAH